MQHIGIQIEDAKGRQVEVTELNFADVLRLCPEPIPQRFPFLSTVDPYGDTVLNPMQVVRCITELREIAGSLEDNEARQLVGETIRFLEKANEDVHRFVRFLGD